MYLFVFLKERKRHRSIKEKGQSKKKKSYDLVLDFRALFIHVCMHRKTLVKRGTEEFPL